MVLSWSLNVALRTIKRRTAYAEKLQKYEAQDFDEVDQVLK